jgi:hypothetical protein
LNGIENKYEFLKNWRTNKDFRQYIQMFGGYMRGIELFIQIVSKNEKKESINYHAFYQEIIFKLKYLYFDGFVYPEDLIYYYLLNIAVDYETKIQEFSIQTLEERGTIVLKKVNNELYISIPYFIMNIYSLQMKGSLKDKNFLEKLLSYDLTNWENFEDFTDFFEIFKQNILSKYQNTLSVKEYFIGGYYSDETAEIKLNLLNIDKRVISKHKFPNFTNFTKLIHESKKQYQWNDEKYFFKNASSAEWADSWKNFNKTVILYQKKTEKLSTERNTISFTEIENEIIKNEKITKIKELEENEFITCILTTKPISNESIKKIKETNNLIVISSESFLSYYGETFCLKLKHCNY